VRVRQPKEVAGLLKQLAQCQHALQLFSSQGAKLREKAKISTNAFLVERIRNLVRLEPTEASGSENPGPAYFAPRSRAGSAREAMPVAVRYQHLGNGRSPSVTLGLAQRIVSGYVL